MSEKPKKRGYPSRYTETFQKRVVADMNENDLSYRTACLKYGINRGVLHRWRKKFTAILAIEKQEAMKKQQRISIEKKKPKANTPTSFKGQKQMIELSHDLEEAQLKIKALELLIEVAEENYQIDIRKKFGAKQ